MLSQYTHEPNYSPAQKIGIFFAIAFALVLIAIAAGFIIDFIHDYKTQLNQAMLYSLGFVAVLCLILLTYIVFYIMAILALNYQSKPLINNEKRLPHILHDLASFNTPER